MAIYVSGAFCSSVLCWLCDTSHHPSIMLFHSVFSTYPPFSPLFFCIFLILISVVSFFPVLFQILTSIISLILLLHLPVTSTVFLVAFIFDKYFSLRLSASWLVHAPGWCGLVDWGGEIKQLLSRHLPQTTRVLHRNLEKLPVLRSLRNSKNIGMCESFCTRKC